jgi:molybdenum cofactor synthesis domain-containing protein
MHTTPLPDPSAPSATAAASKAAAPTFGLIIVGDEILSGKRADKHMARVIDMLAARGLSLAWCEYVGDDPARITATLRRAFASGDVVFCTGGIGATPDDHTRQCAAAALGLPLVLHPVAADLIRERMQDVAREQGLPYEPDRPDNVHRLNMGVFAQGAQIIVPGFPVMAWPMLEWMLDTHYAHLHRRSPQAEKSVIVFGAMEATLTPLMERIEAEHPQTKVFSLPSVDHPQWGRHIELGVKGPPDAVAPAYAALHAALPGFGATLGPELTRP